MATIAELQSELTKYLDARDRILASGQSVTIDGDQYNEATFFRLEDKITDLRNEIFVKQNGGFARSSYVGRG
nr:hypothetical protein [uncultured Pseudodesulfovibrio sp.]